MGYMTDQVNVTLPIFKFSLPNIITKDECKQFRNNFPTCNTSNVKAWHSNYFTHELTNEFDPLIDVTLSKCRDVSKDFYCLPVMGSFYYRCDNLWLAMYKENDYTKIHHHFPSVWASCYYVDVNDDCSPITFGNKDDEHIIQPENGMLLIWSAMIPHRVMPTKNERTCICMNIGVGRHQ
tara:strand:- start:63 stop:599 length:537 start_codon:yes stop_codon:yes gene_type:complete